MTEFDDYVRHQAEQQANRPDSPEKKPLKFDIWDESCDLSAQLDGADIPALRQLLDEGRFTIDQLIDHTQLRIHETAHYNAFLELAPRPQQPSALPSGPLHGVPVAIKGNISTADGMATTAGAAALNGLFTRRDAPLVERLRAAGALIIGKTNLSEWANFYANNSINGYSTLGGHTRHPLGLFDVGGSSSGACVAVALGLVRASIGTETTGSIVYPASQNGVVGVKPTHGLLEGEGIIPIADAFDTAGPIAASVRDAALLMDVLAVQPLACVEQLSAQALRGVRVGLAQRKTEVRAGDALIRQQVVQRLTAAGAVVVDVPAMDEFTGKERDMQLAKESLKAMKMGFRVGVERFLQQQHWPLRTLKDIAAYNAVDAPRRIPSGQELLREAAEWTFTCDDAEACYRQTIDPLVKIYAGLVSKAIDIHYVDVLADFANYASPYHSRGGLPAVTVPAGRRDSGEPLGLTWFGPRLSDARLLSYAYAFEQHPA